MPPTPLTTELPSTPYEKALASARKFANDVCNDPTVPERVCTEAQEDVRRLEAQDDPAWMVPDPPSPDYDPPDACDIYDCTAAPGS